MRTAAHLRAKSKSSTARASPPATVLRTTASSATPASPSPRATPITITLPAKTEAAAAPAAPQAPAAPAPPRGMQTTTSTSASAPSARKTRKRTPNGCPFASISPRTISSSCPSLGLLKRAGRAGSTARAKRFSPSSRRASALKLFAASRFRRTLKPNSAIPTPRSAASPSPSAAPKRNPPPITFSKA